MEDRAIIAELLDDPSRQFDVELWDGSVLPHGGMRSAAGRVVLRSPRAVALLVPPVSEARAAEAFVQEDFEIRGDTVAAMEALARWSGPRLRPKVAPRALSHLLRRSLRPFFKPERVTGDLSAEFFRLFLDKRMVLSSGYFPRGDESLERAQEEQLELACRKLGIRAHDRLLDVGCGWGGLIIYAARTYGADATGLVRRRGQTREARRLVDASEVAGSVRVVDRDYRLLPADSYDKIASLGMTRHLDAARLDHYFRHMFARLRPGGLALHNAVADLSTGGTPLLPWMHGSKGEPAGQLSAQRALPLATIVQAAERQGFEVRDVECFREHHVKTLQHWLARLEEHFAEAVAIVGLRAARAWRLRLAGSAVAFQLGRLGAYQILLARQTTRGAVSGVPRTRRVWYDEWYQETVMGPSSTRIELGRTLS
jgi:cyclopropane-fatty-acyl-phospholipid synthase